MNGLAINMSSIFYLITSFARFWPFSDGCLSYEEYHRFMVPSVEKYRPGIPYFCKWHFWKGSESLWKV